MTAAISSVASRSTDGVPRSFHNMTVLPDGQVSGHGRQHDHGQGKLRGSRLRGRAAFPRCRRESTMTSLPVRACITPPLCCLADATVLVAGGGRRNGRSQPDPQDQQNAEIFSPPYLFKGPRPSISSAPGLLTYGTSFTVDTPDASRIARVSPIALGSVTHAFSENTAIRPTDLHRRDELFDRSGSREREHRSPGPYMLFLVDDVGVPSSATMVRVAADPGIVAAGRPLVLP